MYRQSARTPIYAAHSSITMPPLAAPDEEMAVVMTAHDKTPAERCCTEEKK